MSEILKKKVSGFRDKLPSEVFLIVSGLLAISLVFVYVYRLGSSFIFHDDFARDMYDIMKIANGHPALIGPISSFGSYFNGPYYYYLFAPIVWLFHGNHYSVLYTNVIYFLLALGFFAWSAHKKYGLLPSILATLTIGLNGPYLAAARNPWNGTSYLALLLGLLTLICFHKIQKPIQSLTLGIVAGLIMNIHFSTPLIIVPFMLFSAITSGKKSSVLWMGVGVIVTFIPLVLYELRHNFIMFTNTFINKNYGDFILNDQFPNAVSGKKNFLENAIFISQNISVGIVSPFLVFAFLAWAWWKKKAKPLLILNASLLTGFVLFSAILTFKFRIHYLYSYIFLMTFSVIVAALERKWSLLLALLLGFTLLNFPTYIYGDSFRKGEPYEKAVKFVLNHHLITNKDRFNVLQMSKAYGEYVPTGNEYRFFFEKYGYSPQSSQSYKDSNVLLFFSELKSYDINTFTSWQASQFGRRNFAKAARFESGSVIIYLIRK